MIVLAAIGTAASVVGIATVGAGRTQQARCSPTPVRYVSAKHPTLTDVPWALARPSTAGIAVFLVSYPQTLRDASVNRSDGLVLWSRGEKMVWNVSKASSATRIVAQRLDGHGSFRIPITLSPAGLRTSPTFPAPGCWRLVVRRAATEASVVARVVSRPKAPACAATPIDESSFAVVRPRSAGIAGAWTWRSEDDTALI